MSIDLKDAKERFDKVKNEYQVQFNGLKQSIIALKTQLQQETERKQSAEATVIQGKQELM